MGDTDRITVALLAAPATMASTLYGMLDLFASTCRDWHMLQTGTPGPGIFDTRVVGRHASPFRAANGVTLRPDARLDTCEQPDIVCIPELHLPPGANITAGYDQECEWLRRCYAAGSTLTSICSGSLLLAESGLLDGWEATTHWAFCDLLAARYPDVRVHHDRALVVSGEAQRLIMAGGATSWQDLALYIIGRWVGIEEAIRIARLFLVDVHQSGQQPYALLTTARQANDAVIIGCQEWLAMHYDAPRPVKTMAERSGLTERTFKRRFKAATGMSPMQYVHTLRLEEAKQMLEAGDDPVDTIAMEVGYEDPAFFHRLFSRKVGLTPGRYRKRFRQLRLMLPSRGNSARARMQS